MLAKRIILIVEDDANYAALTRWALEDAGYQVITAGSIGDAIRFADDRCAAVTLDLNLPDSRGRDSLIRLRARLPDIPIIIISGYVTEHEIADLVSLGADACMEKPPDIRMIVSVVERAIRLRDETGSLEFLMECERKLSPG